MGKRSSVRAGAQLMCSWCGRISNLVLRVVSLFRLQEPDIHENLDSYWLETASPAGLRIIIDQDNNNPLLAYTITGKPSWLRILNSRRWTSSLCTSAAEESKLWQIQLVVRAGLFLGIARFQVWHPNHSTTLPPSSRAPSSPAIDQANHTQKSFDSP